MRPAIAMRCDEEVYHPRGPHLRGYWSRCVRRARFRMEKEGFDVKLVCKQHSGILAKRGWETAR